MKLAWVLGAFVALLVLLVSLLHPEGLRRTERDTFEVWIRRMGTLADELSKRGVAVVNCTPGSALKCFAMSALDVELERCDVL